MRSNEFDTVTLYRGDASKVAAFSTEHTRNSIGLLFGMGIYLTNNPRIALDYTVKGGWKHDGTGTVILREEYPSKAEAIRAYLLLIMNDQFGWKEHAEQMKTQWANRFHSDNPYPRVARWDREGNEAQEHIDHAARANAIQEEYRSALREEFGKFLNRAKKVYRGEMADIKVFEDTAGSWHVMRHSHAGTISEFAIPQSYLDRVIHGDRPMDEKQLGIIRTIYQEIYGDRKVDLRDRNEESMRFDDWIEYFKTTGTRYAWREDIVGGKGANPSLDEMLNGTHSGFHIIYKSDDLIARMKAAGYVGIEYDGGVRIGANVRGGGGIRHQSYVFWDDEFINSCRVGTTDAEYDPADAEVLRKITRANTRA